MEKNGISVQYEVTVYSQQYSIPLYVIIETLGILLDNALEYVTNRQNAEIEVMVCESSSNLRIKVKNPIEKISTVEFMSYFELDKSTKGQGRGIGLTKIKQYSEKYEWNIIVGMEDGAENNKIVIEIVIPICSEVKANIL